MPMHYPIPARPAIDARRVDACVEAICCLGCKTVRAIIALLEQRQAAPQLGSPIGSQLAGLNTAERRLVLGELRAIMAVYGASCRI